MTNGLKVVLVHDPRAPEVEVTMRYRAGLVDDPQGEEGMSHLVEHLMFQQVVGAETIWSHELDDTTSFNGFTDLDSTMYIARAPRERLGELLTFEGVRLGTRCASITQSTFDRERQVVINEARLRDAASQLQSAIDAGLFPQGHPYRRAPEDEHTLGAITREQACAFADAHYTPGNAVLVISGNLDNQTAQAALLKALGHIGKRDGIAPVAVPPLPSVGRAVDAQAPIDDDALIVAWPLPADAKLRAQMRVVAATTRSLIDARVRGRVEMAERGDQRAPLLEIAVEPSTGETYEQVHAAVERAIDRTPDAFAKTGFDRFDRFAWDLTTQSAIAHVFGGLEDGAGRDLRLAGYVLAGIDPGAALAGEMEAVRDLTRAGAQAIAREQLSLGRATVLHLRQTPGKKTGVALSIAPPIHDQGQRRDTTDPAAAHQPMTDSIGENAFAGARTRTLPNGMQVVLLPLTSIPTVDVRMVFHAGSADEPVGKRGSALVAGYGLSPSVVDVDDLILFLASGSSFGVDVGTDHTTYEAHGLDMHIDLLLTGLARVIRNGTYADAGMVMRSLRRHAKHQHDANTLGATWRRALYGAGHPYVEAGLVDHASPSLSLDDAMAFHDAHFAPDNATLVIAGKFDADLADSWIDYLFADWTGTSIARESPRAHPEVASVARTSDASSIGITIAIPATAGTTATRRVAAAMLDDIAADVRHQLGASYAIGANLDESRLATSYVIFGAIDASRAKEAVELVRSRIAALKPGDDATAAAFVAARHRVYGRLLSLAETSSGLAARVEHDLDLGRAPLSDIATAGAVRRLTIDDMTETLADLDLAHAAISMSGPHDDIVAAYGVLGRTPTFFEPEKPARTVATAEEPADTEPRVDRAPEPRETKTSDDTSILLQPGYTFSSLSLADAEGFSMAVEIGLAKNGHNTLGIHASLGYLTGNYTPANGPASSLDPFDAIPIEVAAVARAIAYDRLWGGVFAGVQADVVQKVASSSSDVGLCAGVEAGLEIVKTHDHNLGVFIRTATELGGDAGFQGTSLGLTYRR